MLLCSSVKNAINLTPVPAQGLKAYRDKYAQKLRSNDVAYRNYRLYKIWEKSKPNAMTGFLPFKINLSPNSTCNLRCTMCEVSSFPNGSRAPDMPLERFEQIVSANPHVLEYSMSGLSEITMLPNLGAYLRVLKRSGAWVHVVTNGTLLHRKEVQEAFTNFCPDEIQISIDSANENRYEQIRRGSKFRHVCDNALVFNQLLTENCLSKRVKMCSVYQEEGYEGLFSLVKLASALHFEVLAITLDVHDWGHVDASIASKEVQSLPGEVVQELLSMSETLGVRLEFVRTTRKYRHNQTAAASKGIGQLCPWPFIRSFISSDSYLVPCCHISSPAQASFGVLDNLSKSYSLDFFDSAKSIVDFRKRHIEGDIPPVCKLCYLND
jgi:MoaA/NifB/PqqE/SkfB family radical SAM enzyme